MRFTLSLTLVLQAALLLVTLEKAPSAIASFEQRRVANVADPSFDLSLNSLPDIFENADESVVAPRSFADDDDEEEEEYDELKIITVFLPNEEAEEEGVLKRRASPTLCPPNATILRRSAAVQTNANDKRANVAATTTRTKTVTVTKTIYETVYRRCTQYVKRATTTSSKKKTTSSTKKKSTSTHKKTSTSTHKKTTSTAKRASTTSSAKAEAITTSSKRKTTTSTKAKTTSKKTTTSSKPSSKSTSTTSTTSSKSSTTSTSTTSTTSPKPTSTSTSTTTTTSTKPTSTSTSTTTTSTSSSTSTSTTTSSKPTSTSTSTTSSSTSTSTSTSTTSKTTSTTTTTTSTTTTSKAVPTTTSTTTTSSTSSSTTSTTTTTAAPTPKVYSLMANYAGNNFYKNMYFFTYKDPTNGLVDYIGQAEASSLGMVKTTSGGQVYMGYATTRIYPPASTSASVATSTSSSSASTATTNSTASSKSKTTTSSTSSSTTAVSTPYMKSIRVSSYDTFTTGVFILDATHMPVGCGTWPAWWTTPTNPVGGWPNGGEIDIVEGISYTSQNTYSVHTAHGCTVNSTTNSQAGSYQLSNKTLATNCASFETGNQGCGVQSSLTNDFGVRYNKMGGGIHAMVWDADLGIKSYFWSRSTVPDDITAGTPDPSGWGKPQGSWPATNCDPTTYFFNHVSVFTNTICGDWAGDNYLWNNALGGQTTSCAQKTGYSTCKAYVQSADVDFSNAYWLINSVKIYQTTRTY